MNKIQMNRLNEKRIQTVCTNKYTPIGCSRAPNVSLELSPGSRYTHFIVFHSQSLEVLIANTRSPIKRVINTHWAYRYLDNGGRRGADMNV